jgi:hypothetical protein
MARVCTRSASSVTSGARLPPTFPAITVRRTCGSGPHDSPSFRGYRRVVILLAMLAAGSVAGARPAAASPSATSKSSPFEPFVAEAALRFGIPASWINAIMQAESRGIVRAVSPKGAMGLMQILPQTWADLRSRYGLGADPFDPHDNILAGTAYLRELQDRYGAVGSLAAYNAGPGRWEDHLASDRPLPAQTQAYVAALAPLLRDSGSASPNAITVSLGSWTNSPLFPVSASGASGTRPRLFGGADKVQTIARPGTDSMFLAPRSEGLFAPLSAREPTS